MVLRLTASGLKRRLRTSSCYVNLGGEKSQAAHHAALTDTSLWSVQAARCHLVLRGQTHERQPGRIG